MQFVTKPMPHQQAELDCYLQQGRGAFWDMGTGKTWLAINMAARLFLEGRTDGLLVFAPKGMYHQWVNGRDDATWTTLRADAEWMAGGEAPQWLLTHTVSEWAMHSPIPEERVATYMWSSATTKRNLEAQENMLHQEPGVLDVVVINTEAAITDRCRKFLGAFLRTHKKCMCVVDEASMIKNHKAKRSKVIYQVGERSVFRRALTGTPVTNSPVDLYGIFKFIEPEALGRNFTAFRAAFTTVDLIHVGGGRTVEKITGYKNLERLRELTLPFTSRVMKTDVLKDLPPKTYQTILCPLGSEQRRLYDEMREKAVIELMDECHGDPALISATTMLSRLVKLKQIACGYVNDTVGTAGVRYIPDHTRYDALVDFMEMLDNKCIVWFDFRQNVDDMVAICEKKFGKGSCVRYTGVDKNRQSLAAEFKESPKCKWFLATTQTGQYGLNLVNAQYTMFYSRDYNLGNMLQAADRNYRKGQTLAVTEYDLLAPDTIDVRIRERVITKKDIADVITSGEVFKWLERIEY